MNFTYNSIISIFVISIITYIIPNGKCQGLIKWILSIIISLIMLNSILNMFNVSITNNIQKSYINTSANIGVELDENTFKQYLNSIGVKNAHVITTTSNDNGKHIYKIVEINLKKSVIISDKSHIDIMSDIEKIAKQIFSNNVKVIIYE